MALTVALCLTGCPRIGPDFIAEDRLQYAKAVGEAREAQALRNIVQLRYAEFPSFLELTQMTTSTSVLSQLLVSGLARFPVPEDKSDEYKAIQTVAFAETPSFLYLPVEGGDLVHKMLRPANVSPVMALIRTGWEADQIVLQFTTSINGWMNRYQSVAASYPADAEFVRFSSFLRAAQVAKALSIEFPPASAERLADWQQQLEEIAALPSAAAKQAAVAALGPSPVETQLCFREHKFDQSLTGQLDQVRADLGLDTESWCYGIATGEVAEDQHTIAIQTRSLFQIMLDLAAFVDVPPADLQSGAALRLDRLHGGRSSGLEPEFRVHSGPKRPEDSLAAIPYAGSWFWIDRNDQPSKDTFGYLMLLMSITESGGSAAQLVVSTN